MDSEGYIKIISDKRISKSIFWHRRISLGRKDFGLLIGKVIEDGETSIIHIEEVFPVGKLSRASDILEDAKWLDIRSKAADKYPNREIVGWYGIRNGWGAMMMEEDQYIHKNHFMGLWQVMYLLDDRGGLKNFYTWSDDSLVLYRQDSKDDPLDLLKEGRDGETEPGKGERSYPKWIYGALIVAILASISYPVFIRPYIGGRQNEKGKLESVSGSGEDMADAGESDDIDVNALKEVITGLERALEQAGTELELKQLELDEKSQELDDKIKELEERDETIKELEDAKAEALERAESGQDSSKMGVHKFQDGDTLSGLSSKFYGNVKYSNELGRINRITDHNAIRTGTYLIIPSQEVMDELYGRNNSTSE